MLCWGEFFRYNFCHPHSSLCSKVFCIFSTMNSQLLLLSTQSQELLIFWQHFLSNIPWIYWSHRYWLCIKLEIARIVTTSRFLNFSWRQKIFLQAVIVLQESSFFPVVPELSEVWMRNQLFWGQALVSYLIFSSACCSMAEMNMR